MLHCRPEMSRVDVILPAYNAEDTIEESIRSILRQTFRQFRLIIIDDGSTDETGSIVARLAREDSRIASLQQANTGIVGALNFGLRHATAEMVARMDADDICFPDRFQDQVDYLDNHPDCVAVSSNAYHIDASGRRTGRKSEFDDLTPDPNWAPSKEPYLLHPFLMVRREAVVKAGGYRYVYHAEDVDLYWRLLGVGRLHNLDALHGEYRIHPHSVSSKSIENGRLAAVSAQLAAISEIRRRSGLEDLAFSREYIAVIRSAGGLADMIDAAGRALNGKERSALAIATAAKLLDLTSYRPYELESDDCRYISAAIERGSVDVSDRNAAELRFRRIQAARRLFAIGRYREAISLTPIRLLPRILAYHLRLKTGRAWGHVD